MESKLKHNNETVAAVADETDLLPDLRNEMVSEIPVVYADVRHALNQYRTGQIKSLNELRAVLTGLGIAEALITAAVKHEGHQVKVLQVMEARGTRQEERAKQHKALTAKGE